jgi:hypothetical protein
VQKSGVKNQFALQVTPTLRMDVQAEQNQNKVGFSIDGSGVFPSK